MRFVGRITGMKDCRWADPQTEAYAGALVPLGRKYTLSSGDARLVLGSEVGRRRTVVRQTRREQAEHGLQVVRRPAA